MEQSETNKSVTRLLLLRTLFLTAIAAIGVLGSIALGVLISLERVQWRMNEINVHASNQFTLFISTTREELLAYGSVIAFGEIDETQLLTILPYNPNILDIYAVSFDGQILVQQSAVGRPILETEFNPDWLNASPEFGEMAISPIIFEENRPVIDTVMTVNNEIGLPAGLLVSRIDLTDLWSQTLEIDVGETGYAYITDENGELIAFRNRALLGSSLPDLIDRTPQTISEAPLDFYRSTDGTVVLASATPIEGVPWFAIVELPLREALMPIYLPSVFVLILLFGLGWLLFDTARFTQKRIVTPLESLSEAVEELGRGQFSGNLIMPHQDELGRLANAFSSMATQLQELLTTLETRVKNSTRDLKVSAEVARQATTELDIDRLLPQVVKQTRDSFDLNFVSVFLYDPETQLLMMAAENGRDGGIKLQQGLQIPINMETSLTARAGREKRYIVMNDISWEEAAAQVSALPNTRSKIVLPMLVGNRLIGILSMQSEIQDRFSEDDIEILNTLAEQIAIAVNNAQLYATQLKLAAELREADLVKNRFLANMSHELRTPLNGIINFNEMIHAGMIGEINDEQKELLGLSISNSQHLLSLINDVLDITKIQAGQFKIFVEDVDISSELMSVIPVVRSLLNVPDVVLIDEIDRNLPLIRGDRRRIRQIVLNLTSNATKFTQRGSITIRAEQQEDHILLAVIDTGFGIPPEMHELVFEPFIQTKDGVKLIEGTGLGLPITKNLVTAHGGQIWLESALGKGSAFFVSLPIQEAQDKRKK